ncbi:hypothetical protein V2G26_017562 [Clonostachys chloroleuca]
MLSSGVLVNVQGSRFSKKRTVCQFSTSRKGSVSDSNRRAKICQPLTSHSEQPSSSHRWSEYPQSIDDR